MDLEAITERLRHEGHKVTLQRSIIIKLIAESQEHLTPSAIYKKVHELSPDIGEVTVYRTLNILFELGIVCSVHTGHNTQSYIGSPSEHHGHLICQRCGKVINFTGCDLAKLEKRLISETGFIIKG